MVALIDRHDQHHDRCVTALSTLPPKPLVTTWPCLTEAMYLLWRAGGHSAQEELWEFLADGLICLHSPVATERERMRVLMRQYHDAPMDLADSSLVSAAEQLQITTIFTLDRHFFTYRINNQTYFTIVP
jgi:hypothetical protein